MHAHRDRPKINPGMTVHNSIPATTVRPVRYKIVLRTYCSILIKGTLDYNWNLCCPLLTHCYIARCCHSDDSTQHTHLYTHTHTHTLPFLSLVLIVFSLTFTSTIVHIIIESVIIPIMSHVKKHKRRSLRCNPRNYIQHDPTTRGVITSG